MKVGFVGLGKLGLPVAMSVEDRGHEVLGYDPSPKVAEILRTRHLPYKEEGAQQMLDKTNIRLVDVAELVRWADLIFVAVQTPHQPLYEGVTNIPEERVDFCYDHLQRALYSIDVEAYNQQREITVAVISTVLPGTMQRFWSRAPYAAYVKRVYNPFFIAMGTCIQDFLYPEFVLLGHDDDTAFESMKEFYTNTLLVDNPTFMGMSIASAELTKVAYNTFIGVKLAFVNTLQEVCHKIPGADVDQVTDALKQAHRRLISTSYLTAGMGDGGGCHPRDNIALSWLSRKLGMRYDFFEAVMQSREQHSRFLADTVAEQANLHGMRVVVLGKAFKPETNLTVGSPATLLVNHLHEMHGHLSISQHDHILDDELALSPAVYVIATQHRAYHDYEFPPGSVVVDPWRYIPKRSGVTVIGVGALDTDA